MKRKFVLCIGASKSGTTWLYHYLRNQPDFVVGLRKEYNALSVIHSTRHLHVEPRQIRVRSKLSEGVLERQKTHLEMCRSVDAYCDYFDKLTTDGGMTSDISPNYLALSVGNLNGVSARLIDRGFDVYVVLLLRDPVDRLISFSRMVLRYRYFQEAIGVSKLTPIAEVALRLVHDSAFNIDYKTAMENVEKMQPGVEKFIYPFEHLMSKNGVAELGEKLNLVHLPGFEEKVYHRGKGALPPDSDFPYAELTHVFRDQYRYCEEYFASANIKLKWHHA